jgi:hypothetical protein
MLSEDEIKTCNIDLNIIMEPDSILIWGCKNDEIDSTDISDDDLKSLGVTPDETQILHFAFDVYNAKCNGGPFPNIEPRLLPLASIMGKKYYIPILLALFSDPDIYVFLNNYFKKSGTPALIKPYEKLILPILSMLSDIDILMYIVSTNTFPKQYLEHINFQYPLKPLIDIVMNNNNPDEKVLKRIDFVQKNYIIFKDPVDSTYESKRPFILPNNILSNMHANSIFEYKRPITFLNNNLHKIYADCLRLSPSASYDDLYEIHASALVVCNDYYLNQIKEKFGFDFSQVTDELIRLHKINEKTHTNYHIIKSMHNYTISSKDFSTVELLKIVCYWYKKDPVKSLLYMAKYNKIGIINDYYEYIKTKDNWLVILFDGKSYSRIPPYGLFIIANCVQFNHNVYIDAFLGCINVDEYITLLLNNAIMYDDLYIFKQVVSKIDIKWHKLNNIYNLYPYQVKFANYLFNKNVFNKFIQSIKYKDFMDMTDNDRLTIMPAYLIKLNNKSYSPYMFSSLLDYWFKYYNVTFVFDANVNVVQKQNRIRYFWEKTFYDYTKQPLCNISTTERRAQVELIFKKLEQINIRHGQKLQQQWYDVEISYH